MVLKLKKGIVYGPVRSRRLGCSLGINLLPPGRKTCTFDCLYCQYGRADPEHPDRIDDEDFPTVDEVLAAVEGALVELRETPRYLTFSGNGEPTLHPQFAEMVEGLRDVREHLAPDAKIALLSNATMVQDLGVAAALLRIDDRILKLDVGSEEELVRYNAPCDGTTLDGIVRSLEGLPDVTIQSLLTSGAGGNLNEKGISSWIESIKRVRPHLVQIYTLDRPCESAGLEAASHEELDEVCSRLRAGGFVAQVF